MGIISGLSKKAGRICSMNQKKYKELREAHRRLKTSYNQVHKEYRTLFNNTDNGCVILEAKNNGKNFIIKDFNKIAEQIEKIKKSDVIGRQFSHFFTKASETGLLDAFQRVYKTGESEIIPIKIEENGKIKHYHKNTIIRLPNGNLMVLYNETKELEKSKEALEKSRERLKLALESTQIGLWDHNLKTGKVYRSKEWAEMLGFTKQEIDQYSDAWKELIHPDDLPHVEKEAENHESRQKNTFHVEHRLRTKQGNYKWILNWGKIIEYDKDGKPSRAVGTHLDIDERKKTEEKLAELNATKDRLFSIIGHDLKNPLSDILGFSKLLNKNFNNYSPDKSLRFINLINQSATTMNELLDKLLKWSRLQREEVHFNPEKINLTQLFDSLISQFQSQARIKDIKLKHNLKEPIYVYADSNMIETVVRNLISNAVKYTNNSGEISIYTQNTSEKTTVCVADSGIGVDQDKMNKLLQKKKQKIALDTKDKKSTGLGLILCKEIIDLHEEKIWVESEPEKGSIFKFTLPKSDG